MSEWLREFPRRIVPFPIRLWLLQLRRLPAWLWERRSIAGTQATSDERQGFRHLLAAHSSPLARSATGLDQHLQLGKEVNVTRAAGLLDGLIVGPGQVFSHHHAIGRPTSRRGFRAGLELHNGAPAAGIGGGLCQVSNSFYWVAVRAGMHIVERHRHGLDLFPDHERTVPFGCGATVVYNYADFRFRNPLPTPVMLAARVQGRFFVSELWAREDPGWRVEVEEIDHRFFQIGDLWWRENRLRRRIIDRNGDAIVDEEVAHNRGRVMYPPDDGAV